MKYRITAVRVAGSDPNPLDNVAWTYKTVHLVTLRDEYNMANINEALKRLITETVPKVTSEISRRLNAAFEIFKNDIKERKTYEKCGDE